jgi:hypothetical protein
VSSRRFSARRPRRGASRGLRDAFVLVIDRDLRRRVDGSPSRLFALIPFCSGEPSFVRRSEMSNGATEDSRGARGTATALVGAWSSSGALATHRRGARAPSDIENSEVVVRKKLIQFSVSFNSGRQPVGERAKSVKGQNGCFEVYHSFYFPAMGGTALFLSGTEIRGP